METIYTVIVIILLILAILGLVVGVSNDAVNFLNSAIGSKAASRRVIFTVASVGILLGTMTSSGMMEVARSGVFHPDMFTFRDVMMLFLGVMFANVILLDLFNTFGLPTSTTVSLVFGLLGAAVAVASVKIHEDPSLTAADMSHYINSGKALVIISGILSSVVIAFIVGAIVMFISRLIFTFRYQKVLSRFGAIWCGIAFTSIAYFALFKGLKDSGLIRPEFFDMLSAHIGWILLGFWALSSLVMFLLQLAKVSILKVTILAGTFSLALAFAGNDLVNFIGVPIAGLDSYSIAAAAGGDDSMLMGKLSEPVIVNPLYLLIAGSYTPILLYAGTPLAEWYTAGIWIAAAAGIILTIRFWGKLYALHIALYIAMGWSVMAIYDELVPVLPPCLIPYMVTGGIIYTAGVVFYAAKRIAHHHLIWHIFVLAGSISFFIGYSSCLLA